MPKSKSLYLILLFVFNLPACNESLQFESQPDLRKAVAEGFKQDRVAYAALSYDYLKLLETRRFEELDNQLMVLQENYEQGANEWVALKSFLKFNTRNERYSPYFDEWVAHNNGRWTGQLARGIHRVAVAWKKRGDKFIRETTREQIDEMNHYFSMAKKDINAALEKKPRAIVGYKMLHQIATGLGEDEDKQKITETVLKIAPDTYYLRWQLLSGLQPKWGGSLKQIRKLAREAQKWRKQNPRVYALLGYEHAVIGETVERRKQYEEAVEAYSKALKYAPVGSWLSDRASCLRKLERFDEETRDLNALIMVSPDDAELLGRRGLAYVSKGHYPSAIVDLERALEIDPTLGLVANNLGWIYLNQGNNEQALNYFDKTLLNDPDNVYALTYCGIANSRLGQLVKAESCLSHAVEVAPEDATAWRNYGEVLHLQDDPKHLEALARYLKYADREQEKDMYEKIEKYLAEKKYRLPSTGSSTTRGSGT